MAFPLVIIVFFSFPFHVENEERKQKQPYVLCWLFTGIVIAKLNQYHTTPLDTPLDNTLLEAEDETPLV